MGTQARQEALPLWVHPAYSKHIVRGNFMALSTRPKTVEMGDWIAHQGITPTRGSTAASSRPRFRRTSTCLMQRWVASKTDDPHLFPTDPEGVSYAPNPAAPTTLPADPDDWVGKRSGFPREFSGTCKAIFLQMFRVYAHLFSRHFVDPFYHLNLEKQLNSCFSHFLLTATSLDMLHADNLEPVQLLIDLWRRTGRFRPDPKRMVWRTLRLANELWRPLEIESASVFLAVLHTPE
ncbi:hypothetical protein HMPREF1624_06906 [Sporothrix schenckii ATCC 58251]|uniref:Uncharacterized protein n=1 Tax=Sporothrix schenckii (strain ATCC 58251 / de Perez 2211183) TaxID=1391915 RepID=U7PMA1_SPOS1|nr:hypothetical protein HMPREF1624_06906 [Sporothrix schenckii ATCC 58251]